MDSHAVLRLRELRRSITKNASVSGFIFARSDSFAALQKGWPDRAVLARTEGDVYHNILIEFAKDRNHPVEREPAKLRVAETRKFGVRNTGRFLGIAC